MNKSIYFLKGNDKKIEAYAKKKDISFNKAVNELCLIALKDLEDYKQSNKGVFGL